MSGHFTSDDRFLSAAERDMVALSKLPLVAQQTEAQLHALARRLRAARDRARHIGHQQRREMRGKAPAKGIAPARDNTGTEAKAQVLTAALARITQALRRLKAPSQSDLSRKALAQRQAASAPNHPAGGRTAGKGMQAHALHRAKVRIDPRRVGRVSQAGKVAQARRDH